LHRAATMNAESFGEENNQLHVSLICMALLRSVARSVTGWRSFLMYKPIMMATQAWNRSDCRIVEAAV
jgi:hypothetical protein